MFITDLSTEKAKELADQRRKLITNLLQEGSSVEYEFLELPKNYEGSQRESRYFENREEVYGQMARLRWQIDSTEYLLLERLTDLIIAFIRDNKEFSGHYPLIKLEPLEKTNLKKGNFIWKAVIETRDISFYHEVLYEFKDWIGLSVELREKIFFAIKPNGRCVDSDKEGTIGGHILYDNEEYAMTCSHVLAPNCRSVLYRGERNQTPFQYNNQIYQAPDAALISINTPCFPMEKGTKTFLACANEQVYITAANNRVIVTKNPSNKYSYKKGYISNPGTLMPMINGTAYRFPHVGVRLAQKRYLFGILKFPIYSYFSQGGDSGSWVLDSSTNIWYGMVIGSDDLSITYILQCEPLLDFFRHQIGFQNANNISPFIYN